MLDNLDVIINRDGAHAGKPLIFFVHGAWHGMWCWELWMAFFRAHGYPVAAMSLRGHGKSGRSYKNASLDDYAADVRQVLEHLDAKPVLVGHSMGGYLVQQLMHTETYPAAVMVSATTASGLPRGASLRQSLRHPGVTAKVAARWDMKPWVEKTELVKELFFAPDTPLEYVAPYANRMDGESIRAILQLMQPAPAPLPGTPLLVMGGSSDATLTESMFRRTANEYGADCVMIPAGHDIMLDTAQQDGAETLLHWLEAKV